MPMPPIPVPVLIAGGLVLAAGAGVLIYEETKKKKPEQLPGIMPKGADAVTATSAAPASGGGGGGGMPTSRAAVAQGPTVIPKAGASKGLSGMPSSSVNANLTAHLTQPQPPGQPPLPPAPAQALLPPGRIATVNTKDTGNAGALRVRIAPSTTASAVAGGEPGSGGGYPHLSTIEITGDMVEGFSPSKGRNGMGQEISGYAWAGYLLPSGGNATGGFNGEEDLYDMIYPKSNQSDGNIKG